jgi:hypothetical protein
MAKTKKGKKKLAYGGNQQEQAQANTLVSGVGAINPLIGTAMKLGQAVGSQTMDENGIYKSKAGQFLDNSINPTTGISNIKDVLKDPSVGNVANQLTLGLVGKGATQKRRENEMKQQRVRDDLAFRTTAPGIQTLPTYKEGGKLSSTDVMGGGMLQSISPDAVQVKANNPAQTDSVELKQAFVDHNEVIDNQERVFSDSIRTPGGRTVAKEAARLEKMKSKSSRFDASNSYVDGKLDKLFAYQEGIKKPRRVGGGPLTEDPTVAPLKGATLTANTTAIPYEGPTYTPQQADVSPETNFNAALANLHKAQRMKNSLTGVSMNQAPFTEKETLGQTSSIKKYRAPDDRRVTVPPQDLQKMDSVLTTRDYVLTSNPRWFGTKPGQALGGKIGEEELVPGSTKVDLRPEWQKTPLSGGLLASSEGKANVNPFANFKPKDTGPQFSFSEPKKMNFGNVAAGAGQFASDAVNLYLASKQAKPKAPNLERRVELGRVSGDAQLAENARQTANANKSVRQSSSQAGQILSNQGANLAKRMYADNQVNQAVQNQNTELIGREALLNTNVGARNVERQNQFKADSVAAKNAKLSNYSQIASNVGTKALQMRQEGQKKEYDRAYLDVLRSKYKDSGLNDRFVDMIMKRYEDQAYKKGSFKYGGKMGKKKC